MMIVTRRTSVLTAWIGLALLSACSSSASGEQGTTTDPTTETVLESSSLRGLRYCEVLLLNLSESGLQAEVYNTYPLNDCSDAVWRGLDGGTIAQDEGVPFAILNGPRFWLMDAVERLDDGSVISKTFSGSSGAMEMNRYAVVTLGSPDTIGQAYTPQSVDRKARFTFRTGATIYILSDPDGQRFVMQSWSQQRDPNLTEIGLADLGARLELPEGWTFTVETLSTDLILDSTTAPARVFQDELMNTYTLMPG